MSFVRRHKSQTLRWQHASRDTRSGTAAEGAGGPCATVGDAAWSDAADAAPTARRDGHSLCALYCFYNNNPNFAILVKGGKKIQGNQDLLQFTRLRDEMNVIFSLPWATSWAGDRHRAMEPHDS